MKQALVDSRPCSSFIVDFYSNSFPARAMTICRCSRLFFGDGLHINFSSGLIIFRPSSARKCISDKILTQSELKRQRGSLSNKKLKQLLAITFREEKCRALGSDSNQKKKLTFTGIAKSTFPANRNNKEAVMHTITIGGHRMLSWLGQQLQNYE